MDREKESTPTWSTTDVNRHAGTYVLETPLRLKRLAGSNDIGEFSGFQNENRGTMLANIMVAFQYMDKDMMKKIQTSMIHPRLEYAPVV